MTSFDNSEHIQRAVLHVVGKEKSFHKPGSFLTLLIQACVHADTNNTQRLNKGFPVVVAAVRAYQFGMDIDNHLIIKRWVNR